jgi:hypothetical protein
MMNRQDAVRIGFSPVILYGREVIENALTAYREDETLEFLGGQFKITAIEYDIDRNGLWTGAIQITQVIPMAKLTHSVH